MNWERVKKVLLALGKLVLTAALTVVFKALFAGDSLAGLVKVKQLGTVLKAGVPFWILLVAILVCVLLFPSWYRSVRQKKPKLFMAWQGTSGWGWGGILQPTGKMEDVLAIHGDVLITTENLYGMVTLVDVQLRGAKRANNFGHIVVKPGATFQQKIPPYWIVGIVRSRIPQSIFDWREISIM
jgi:hypothetical protein